MRRRKRNGLLFVLVLTMIMGSAAGCGQQRVTQEQAVSETEKAQTMTEEKTEGETGEGEETGSAQNQNGSPWLNSSLYQNVPPEIATDPRQDLHLYVNKDWFLDVTIPDGWSSWSNYGAVEKETKDKAIEMLQDNGLSGHDAELIRQLFQLYLDTDARKEAGYTPIRDTVDKILQVEKLEDLTALYLDEELKYKLGELVEWNVGKGISDSDSYYVYADLPGLTMGDAAEYVGDVTEYGQMRRDFNRDMFVYMMGRLGMDGKEADRRYENMISLESELAKNIYTNEERMRSDFFKKMNNVVSQDEMIAMSCAYPMKEIMKAQGVDYGGKYIVVSPDYLKALDHIYTQEHLEALRDYTLVCYVLRERSALDKETEDYSVELNQKYFGVEGETSLEERAYNIVKSMLAQPLAREYVKRYSSEEDRKRVEDVCYQVIDTYREILSENDWASKETMDRAIKKLDAITVNVGWPKKWGDYSSLDISGLSYYEAVYKIGNFNIQKILGRLGSKPDKENWAEDLDLLSCNAYYNYLDNSINMLCGMMGAPFYCTDMPVEELYASLGAFWIGHEVSHAFDSGGAQYDVNGNLNNWWAEEDLEEFNARVKKMDDYLDGIRIMGDYYVNGSNVDSEMIADMTGVQCALKMAESVEGFDYRKFFEYFGKMNRSVSLYASQLSQIQGDSHPLDYQRTNVPVQQFEEFYETYGVKEGDGMYLAPKDRLVIW